MAASVLKRIALLVLTLFIVTVLAFAAFSVIPGDPTAAVLGLNATDEQIAALRVKLGLDLPIYRRYLNWLGGFVKGDFGVSYKFGIPVSDLLSSRIEATFALTLVSFILIIAISIPLGVASAKFHGGFLDRLITVLSQVTMSVPNFVMGIGVMYIFALVLKIFRPAYVPLSEDFFGHIAFIFFPALAIALPKSAMTVRLLRGSVIGELEKDYIRTAYSKGNTTSAVLWRHLLRNAMIPIITFLAVTVADIVAASIVIEQLFSVPGIGQMLITSIGNRDYPVVQAIIVIVASIVVICNFAADILYRVLDPRIDRR